MPTDPLASYREKRDFEQTPEPGPADGRAEKGTRLRFVVQEHHARALHWDLRLEHDGVLWSWAVPKGIPMRNRPNHLAVRTEDHPLQYLDFEADIPAGQYGAGTMRIWDSGTYEPEKLRDDEVIVTFHGQRVRGQYALFRTGGDQWMIHRMSPPEDPTRAEIPTDLTPMLAVAGPLPSEDGWCFEMKWDGMRALLRIEGGRVRLTSRRGADITDRFPELRALGEAMGTTEAILDGEIVALDEHGRPRFELLQGRIHVDRAGEGPPARRHPPGRGDALRRVVARGALDPRVHLPGPPVAPRAAGPGRPALADAPDPPRGRRRGAARRRGPGPRGGGRQARRQPVPPRGAVGGVAEGEGGHRAGASWSAAGCTATAS